MSIKSIQTVKKYIQVSMGLKPTYSFPDKKMFNMTNHLYMAVIAMGRMNAEEQEIEKFSKNYLNTLPLQQTKNQFNHDFITEKNFDEYIGDYDKYEEYLSFFKNENKQKDVKQIIQEYLPKLSPGIGSEAFHCLIQMGYAIDWEMQSEEILQGLAYLCLQNTRLYPDERSPLKKDAFQTLQELKDLKPYFKQITSLEQPLSLSQKINIILKDEKLISILPQEIQIYDNLLDDLSLAMLKLYAETQNFIILHAISGFTCLRQLLPYINEQDKTKVINDFLRHIYIWYSASSIEHLTEQDVQKKLQIPEKLPSWEELFKKANNSSDDHDIKFVYICSVEANHYGQESEHGRYARYAAHLRMLENNSRY